MIEYIKELSSPARFISARAVTGRLGWERLFGALVGLFDENNRLAEGYKQAIDETRCPSARYGSFSGAHPGFWPFRASPQSLV